jgi:hypothetical protein
VHGSIFLASFELFHLHLLQLQPHGVDTVWLVFDVNHLRLVIAAPFEARLGTETLHPALLYIHFLSRRVAHWLSGQLF